MREFCDWACSRPKREAVIAVGHSLWFKSFFDVYLPKSADSIARKRKMSNCSCVALTLQKGAVGARARGGGLSSSVSQLAGNFFHGGLRGAPFALALLILSALGAAAASSHARSVRKSRACASSSARRKTDPPVPVLLP